MVARLILVLVVVAATGCATVLPPSPHAPRAGCVVSCPGGWAMVRQHLCRGTRWFKDILVVGEYVTRGADGTKSLDMWIAGRYASCEEEMASNATKKRPVGRPCVVETGQYTKEVVELETCQSVIARIVQSRGASERGCHPGETCF